MEKFSKQEIEEQEKIAKTVGENFRKESEKLLAGYGFEVQEAIKKSKEYQFDAEDTRMGKRLKAFLESKNAKPSDFFRKEKENMQGWVRNELLEDFYISIDSVIKWQFSRSYYRRTVRTKKYSNFLNHFFEILNNYHEMGIYETDIVSVYRENMPKDKVCYFRQRQSGSFLPVIESVWIQAELDRGNEELRAELTDIIMGEDNQSKLNYAMIKGIIMSEDRAMHEALGKLLLAAKLQEGLRQAICENMDCGTAGAFMYLFKIVKENDLLRYSSVLRAVATWTGLYSGEGKIDRIEKKQLELISDYLEDENKRQEALSGEDSMKIYLALWSYGFFDIEEAQKIVFEKVLYGTKHQRMVCCLYMKNMSLGNVHFHELAKKILKEFYDEQDTMAVLTDLFMPNYSNDMYHLVYEKEPANSAGSSPIRKRVYADYKKYFESEEECAEYYEILKDMLKAIPKKKITYTPYIFPWNSEQLDRSAIIMRFAMCASALKDEEKITEAAALIPELDSLKYNRSFLVLLLLSVPQNERQKEMLVAAVADKEEYTRRTAASLVKEVDLSEENYIQLENMLKYKNAEIRSNVIQFLCRMGDEDIEVAVQRLLGDKTEEKRTAGLDILLQMKKDEKKQAVFEKCVKYIDVIKNPSTKEEILIKELVNKSGDKPNAEDGFGLYDVNAVYEPVFDKEYLAKCQEVYKNCFPHTQIGTYKGIGGRQKELTGKKSGLEMIAILKKLDALIETHKLDEFTNSMGETELLGMVKGGLQTVSHPVTNRPSIPFEDMWRAFYKDEIKNYETCLALKVYLAANEYEDERFEEYSKSFIAYMFGDEYAKPETFSYYYHLRTIINYLEDEYADAEIIRKVSVAAADYLLSVSNQLVTEYPHTKKVDANGKNVILRRSILSAAKIRIVTYPLSMYECQDEFSDVFPYHYALAEKHNFKIPVQTQRYICASDRMMDKPAIAGYITAYSLGIITKDFLYKIVFEKENRGENTEFLSDIMQYYLEAGRSLSGRQKDSSWTNKRRMQKIKQLLGHEPAGELSKEDVKRMEIAKELYENISGLMMEAELTRGDSETEFSCNIYSLKRIYGVQYFVRILAALGKETLERSVWFDNGWYSASSVSKRNSLSHLLQVCMPKENDGAAQFSECLKGTDIKTARLIEAATYSPEWIGIVADYLKWDGFAAGCYYFMAHMNDRFDNKRKAIIARYTPLTAEELNDGAFDLKWFSEVYEKLGEKHFKAIYDAAKYISNGAKHIRARKYADASLGRLDETEIEKTITDKRNKDLLMAYGLIPISSEKEIQNRYLFLQRFKKESKQFGAQRRASEARAVDMAMQNLAINAGYQDVTRLTLRMESLVAAGMADYFKPHAVGGVSVWLEVNEGGKIELVCEKAGKRLKSVPANMKKEEYVLEITESKKALTEQYRRTKLMLEEAMETVLEFTVSEIRGIIHNPVTKQIAEMLIYKCGDKLGILTDEGLKSLGTASRMFALKEDDRLVIAHPLDFYNTGYWYEYQKYLFDNKWKQPFKQVFRELYVKTDEEREMYHSLRYAGNQIQPVKTLGCLKSRRWVADVENGLQKVYYKENIVAGIYALADWFSPADIESPTLEWVVFSDRRTGKELKIDDIPDIIFSEVMRDVDMAVSVAHAGAVDPETSHSTIEMRKVIAEFTMPLFRLTNVTFTKSHAVIEGKRANYTVHLGSGVVHQEAGSMINVLPVHSERRGRIFLPFMDEDPKTAEILTKILFFAEDSKIKDPFILNQIR